MKNILVTGASGLIGSRTCSGLLKKGFNVFGVDSILDEYNIGKENYEFIEAKVIDKNKYEEIFSNNKFDSVINCACTVDNDLGTIITENEINSSKEFDKFIFKFATSTGVTQFVQLSTTQIYDTPKTREPIREDDSVKINTNYAKMKFASEKVIIENVKLNPTMITAVCRVAPIYSLDFYDNLIVKILDPKDNTAFMYRSGEYGFQFCCVHNLVDFIISFVRQAEEKNYTGVYNIADSNIITASEIAMFMRANHKLGPIIQKNYNKDIIMNKINMLKHREEFKTNYRYLDLDTILNNNRISNTKSSRICNFKWNIQNTK